MHGNKKGMQKEGFQKRKQKTTEMRKTGVERNTSCSSRKKEKNK